MNWGIWLLAMLISTSAFAIRNGVSGRYFNDKKYLVEFTIDRGRDIEGVCSGVRISQTYILTVAHCFQGVRGNESFKLRYYRSNGRASTVTTNVDQVILLDTKLVRELALVPIQDPGDDFEPPTLYQGDFEVSPIRFFGYGMNRGGHFRGLQTATLNFSYLRDGDLGRTFVTSPGIGDAHPCPGDSGGPLFKEVDGEQQLLGVISTVGWTRGNLREMSREQACRLGNRAYFIPLQDHLDFLKTYIDVATNLAEKETNPDSEPVATVD